MKEKITGLILDFDMTLFDTRADNEIRKVKKGKDINWEDVYAIIPQYRLYDGWREVFQYAKRENIKIAIVSTAKGELIKRTLEHFDLRPDAIIGWQLYHRKPSGKLVDMALKKIGVNKPNVLSIGDSVIDREMSNNGAVSFVGAMWDSEDSDKLKDSMTIKAPVELIKLLT